MVISIKHPQKSVFEAKFNRVTRQKDRKQSSGNYCRGRLDSDVGHRYALVKQENVQSLVLGRARNDQVTRYFPGRAM